ncbi:hypothetical protein AVKW3434_03020 [Acidovorax sp. SUPP3434]|uniref:hypothetical protein n=1 Tax=Acidovorax sp. SUPP3434 TaxID=2920880 RepID=UPI0023DE3808|nr:hypothetical protein [Acidovorax sp. SUPP3434]GKS98314.1 hypothetical protein AVKW3434_03020 [Acidovorax sp. SUPP3434]
MNTALKPVRTREDCFEWLKLEEVQEEVFAAFVGAKRHFRTWDFDSEAVEADSSLPLLPGTVISADGEPWADRWSFLEYMLAGIVWRVEALARSKGVDLTQCDVASCLGSPLFAREGFSAPVYSSLGGAVTTITDAQIRALPAAQRKALKAAVKAGRPVTLPTGSLGGL